ncbi:MAG: RDD family protein [Planctomycetes bacterium]|nr:RDD family protein [Planctomycetota bacterium]MCC7170174.1 RDD family protein [Planctomycetota bacterium]
MDRHPEAPPQEPVPDLPYAEPVRRVAAYLVDVALVAAVMVGGVHFGLIQNLELQPELKPPSVLLWVWVLVTMSLPTWIYFAAFESSSWQATLGKRLLRIVVTDMDTQRLSFRHALVRTWIKLLPWELIHVALNVLPNGGLNEQGMIEPSRLQLIGFTVSMFLVGSWLVTLMLTPRAQSVHDVMARTLVLKRPTAG